ncbi:MAG: restriction endonuclease subunit S [Bacteroidales bacterium]|nr:restriction endonuclease subunit S [Bacteroidales bacterium]
MKWLGEIPSHWRLVKSKYLWKESFATSENGNEELLSVSQYDGITPAKGDSRSESLKGYKIVSENDLVINIMLAWMGGLGVSNYNGIVSPAYCIYKLNDDSNPKFLHYLYKTPLYLAEFARHSTGVIPSRWRMYTDDFGQVLSLIPPREEQDAIVSYLDERTAKIDAAIAQQQKMIDLLNERKQIIINRAVTKGLNPNAKMKDSGVEWIGEVPEGWEVRRMGSLGEFSKGGNISRDDLQEYGKCAILYGDIYTKYNIQTAIVRNHISEKVAEKSVRISKGDILMTSSGETKEDIGKTIVYLGNEEAFIGGDVILFRQQNNDSTFLSYALNSQYAKDYRYKESKGEIIVHIYASSLKRLYLALPPIEEQIKVVNYLDGQIDAIDNEIEVINKQISLLQERKQIIINEVVTGKVKVG